MNRIFLLVGSGILATTVAMAQSLPGNSREGTEANSNSQTQSHSYQTTSSVVRGCLSGSAGNYTLTDQNGMQYRVLGDDASLQGKVGHEVEVTARQDQSSETSIQGDQTTARTTNSIQVSDVREVSASCNKGSSMSAPPATEENGVTPKGTPDAAEPPEPQMISMLQQQSPPDAAAQQQNGTSATPPVTSQTPAAPSSPTSANPQAGSSPANNTGMTESEANHDAQAARQGELNTNPQSGDTNGRGINNQGVNNPASTPPNAVPTSSNSATPSSNTQPPQSNANDQNKPLYERPATDIPWANQSGGNTGTPAPPH